MRNECVSFASCSCGNSYCHDSQTQQKEETPPRAVNSGQLNYFTSCSPI